MIRLSTVQRNNRKFRTFQKYSSEVPSNNTRLPSKHKGILLLVTAVAILFLLSQIIPILPLEPVADSVQNVPALSLSIVEELYESSTSIHESLNRKCEHTTPQHHGLVCDSNGQICAVSSINTSSQCCAHDSSILPAHSCSNCDSTLGCCSHYETCVSCCLKPSTLPTSLRLRDTHFALKNASPLQLCAFLCHTSSASLLQSENSFRSEYKHCFLGYGPPVEKSSVNSDRSSVDEVLPPQLARNHMRRSSSTQPSLRKSIRRHILHDST